MPRHENNALDKFLQEQQESNYIRPSKSPYAAPLFFIGKKDGEVRPVQDYRVLNSYTVKNNHPLPLISELIDRVAKALLFSKVNVRKGFNNIRIKEGDEWKAAFKTNRGLFKPTVMFFGLTNSPSTFQSMMDTIFKDLVLTGEVVIYMDDILIATPDNLTHHRQLVHRVLDRLEEHDLYLKPKKCVFEVREVEFLGVILGHGQVRMDPVKVKGVLDWPIPQNLKVVQSFLGFYNFYRRFIKGFATLARPLNKLLKKEVPWEWTSARQLAFETLKGGITQAPVLAMPDYEKPFELEVDTSNYALGAVLNQ